MRRAFAIGIVALGLTLASPALVQAQVAKDQPVLISADRVEYDQNKKIVTASGHVEVSQTTFVERGGKKVQEDRIVLADNVTYSETANVVTATGHVSLLEPTGDVVFADHVELSDDMKEGVIRQLRMLLADNSRMAAASGKRTGGVVTEMRKAIYSPCELCKDKPDRPPLWQLRANKVVHNQDTHDIQYYNAFLDIFGFPILYTPYLSHPDPTVKQRTGLLAPVYGNSSDLGFIFGLPYYVAIDQSTDLLLRPIVTQNQGPVFATEFREKFTHGELDLQGSITDADFTNSSGAVEHDTVRGHIYGKGRFDLNDNWRTGFDVARASDDTYLQRYNFPYQNVLTTRGYLEDFDKRNYASLQAYTFQGLRPFDDADTTPLVAPLFDYNFVGAPSLHGSYFTFDTNFMSLTRIQGVDSHRLSLIGGWHLPYTGEHGDVFEVTFTTQADAYVVDNVPDPTSVTGQTQNGLTGRVFPQLALTWRYPLVRAYKTQRQLIEPIASVVVGPNGSNPDKIPNEDSQSFEFDDADLFNLNRFPGLDRVEGGQRLDYGINTGLYDNKGGSITAFFGQSARLRKSSPFAVGSGLEDRLSDFVGRIQLKPVGEYDILYRFRLDKDTLQPRRNEVAFSAGPRALNFSGSYIFLSEESGGGGFDVREELSARVSSKLNDFWTVSGQTIQDLGHGDPLSYRADVTYEDECFALSGIFVRNLFRDREIHPSTTFLFQFTFRNLGEFKT
jgi:LPS-assembly protein